MTGLDIVNDIKDIVTAGAAIVAGIQSWRAHAKSTRIEKEVETVRADVKAILAQQQAQKQSQSITVNVGTGAASAKTEAAISLSDSEEGQ